MGGHARVLGATLLGIDGIPVEVEVRISSQLPRINIVGLPEAAVRESAARVRAAVQAIGMPFPDRRITVSLAPAALRKQGAGLDLAIAAGILAAAGTIPPDVMGGVGLIGELALDGRLRPVRGALALASSLQAAGCGRVILPASHAREAGLLGEPAPELGGHLGEVIERLATGEALAAPGASEPEADGPRGALDLALVRGQGEAKRALLIAAAGGHGLLLRGAPGAGKTLLARCLPGLLPPLSRAESLEVARIHDAAGLLDDAAPRRPFRAPHHSASRAGLLGGGPALAPGEVTLAHRGVLFLDELPEFDRSALEALRQILEEGRVAHARAVGRVVLPARFQLVAAANPCRCGWYGSGVRDCRCDDGALARYEARISGPLLDRIDLHLAVQPVPLDELERRPEGPGSEALRARVVAARERGEARLARAGLAAELRHNAAIPIGALEELVRATPDARRVLFRAAERLALSARAAHRLMRVARTIADLEGEERVGPGEMAEAVGYRRSPGSAIS